MQHSPTTAGLAITERVHRGGVKSATMATGVHSQTKGHGRAAVGVSGACMEILSVGVSLVAGPNMMVQIETVAEKVADGTRQGTVVSTSIRLTQEMATESMTASTVTGMEASMEVGMNARTEASMEVNSMGDGMVNERF